MVPLTQRKALPPYSITDHDKSITDHDRAVGVHAMGRA